jgi:hypothetical protein
MNPYVASKYALGFLGNGIFLKGGSEHWNGFIISDRLRHAFLIPLAYL